MYWTTGILGIALVIAPFILGYTDNTQAMWTSFFIGGVTVVVSWIEAIQADREQWEYWTAAILGLAAIASPFLLNYSGHATAMWTSIVAGVLIALFAGSKLMTGQWGRS